MPPSSNLYPLNTAGQENPHLAAAKAAWGVSPQVAMQAQDPAGQISAQLNGAQNVQSPLNGVQTYAVQQDRPQEQAGNAMQAAAGSAVPPPPSGGPPPVQASGGEPPLPSIDGADGMDQRAMEAPAIPDHPAMAGINQLRAQWRNQIQTGTGGALAEKNDIFNQLRGQGFTSPEAQQLMGFGTPQPDLLDRVQQAAQNGQFIQTSPGQMSVADRLKYLDTMGGRAAQYGQIGIGNAGTSPDYAENPQSMQENFGAGAMHGMAGMRFAQGSKGETQVAPEWYTSAQKTLAAAASNTAGDVLDPDFRKGLQALVNLGDATQGWVGTPHQDTAVQQYLTANPIARNTLMNSGMILQDAPAGQPPHYLFASPSMSRVSRSQQSGPGVGGAVQGYGRGAATAGFQPPEPGSAAANAGNSWGGAPSPAAPDQGGQQTSVEDLQGLIPQFNPHVQGLIQQAIAANIPMGQIIGSDEVQAEMQRVQKQTAARQKTPPGTKNKK